MKRALGMMMVMLGCVGLASAAPMIVDFSTDPNLATEWTTSAMYDGFGGGNPAAVTAAWNSGNQNLDLASTNAEALRTLNKNGLTRTDTEGATVTYTNYQVSSGMAWSVAGLMISVSQTPVLFSQDVTYCFVLNQEGSNYFYKLTSTNNTELNRSATLASIPSIMQMEILRDGTDYVFMSNGTEIFRDATLASTSLPYVSMTWGGAGSGVLTLQADDFGVVPEPMTMSLLAVGGLLAIRRRR